MFKKPLRCLIGLHKWKYIYSKVIKKEIFLGKEIKTVKLEPEFRICELCGEIWEVCWSNGDPLWKIKDKRKIVRIYECIEDKGKYYLLKPECGGYFEW